MTDFAAYDVFMLQRQGAAQSYQADVLARAKTRFDALSDEEKIC